MQNEAALIRLARAAIGTRAKERAKERAKVKDKGQAKPNDASDVPAARVSRALARKRADAYAAFVVATAKAATAARRKEG
jgi:hypothetical protein